MKSLSDIQRQLASGAFEFSHHAFRRVVEGNMSEQEIQEAGANAEVIEDYPDDKYSPSGLWLGFTARWTALAPSGIVYRVGFDEGYHDL